MKVNKCKSNVAVAVSASRRGVSVMIKTNPTNRYRDDRTKRAENTMNPWLKQTYGLSEQAIRSKEPYCGGMNKTVNGVCVKPWFYDDIRNTTIGKRRNRYL